jgi:hypothetical protein
MGSRQSESPRSQGGGPAAKSNRLDFNPTERPIDRILERLHRVRRSGRGWIASCPAHDDRFPSLSIGLGRGDRVLICCHRGCRPEDIVTAIGLTMADLFEPNDDWKPPPRRKPSRIPRDVARSLLWRQQFPLEFETAKVLATISPEAAKRQLVLGRDYLNGLGVDVGFVWRTITMLRAIALFTFCDRHHARPEDVSRAVRRLLRHVEEEVAA